MGVEIIRGSRSNKYAATDWTCSCGHINRVKNFLIFDLPSFNCERVDCRKPYGGLIYFNLADVEVNGRSILPEVKDQRPHAECIPFAFAHAQELNDTIESIILNDDSAIESTDPWVLASTYARMFSSVKDNKNYGDYHKYLYIGPILRDSTRGVVKDAKRKARSDCCAVNKSKTEHICQYIADGRGVVGVFKAGPKLAELKLGEVYFSPSDSTFEHAVLLIGAIVGRDRVIYIFLNSWGKAFCAFHDENGNIVMDENGNIAMGGIGMVETSFSCNPVVLSRSWEKGASARLSVSWSLDLTRHEVDEETCQVVWPYGKPTFVYRKVWKSIDLGPFGVAKDGNQDTSDDEASTFDRLMHSKVNMINIGYTPWSLLYGHNWLQHQPLTISSSNGRECEHNAMFMSKLDSNTEEKDYTEQIYRDCTLQMEMSDIKEMVLGKPASLISTFRLSYYAILHLMGRVVGQFTAEHVIRNSVHRLKYEKALTEIVQKITGSENEATLLDSSGESDLAEYHKLGLDISELEKKIMSEMITPSDRALLYLVSGRLDTGNQEPELIDLVHKLDVHEQKTCSHPLSKYGESEHEMSWYHSKAEFNHELQQLKSNMRDSQRATSAEVIEMTDIFEGGIKRVARRLYFAGQAKMMYSPNGT